MLAKREPTCHASRYWCEDCPEWAVLFRVRGAVMDPLGAAALIVAAGALVLAAVTRRELHRPPDEPSVAAWGELPPRATVDSDPVDGQALWREHVSEYAQVEGYL